MSLRDQFAGSALRGILQNIPHDKLKNSGVVQNIAARSFDIADAMLEIRASRYGKDKPNGYRSDDSD